MYYAAGCSDVLWEPGRQFVARHRLEAILKALMLNPGCDEVNRVPTSSLRHISLGWDSVGKLGIHAELAGVPTHLMRKAQCAILCTYSPHDAQR